MSEDDLSVLSSRQREIVRLARTGRSFADIALDLGLQVTSVSSAFYSAMQRMRGARPPALRRWDRDSDMAGETPAETRARVASEIATGVRCRAPMFSGRPCSLLLPCHTHGANQ